jgi:hypothetical protein
VLLEHLLGAGRTSEYVKLIGGDLVPALPDAHQAGVAEHRVQPAAGRLCVADAREPRDGHHERFLHKVHCLVAVVQQRYGSGIQRCPVSLQEHGQCLRLARAGEADKLRVGDELTGHDL